MKQRFHAQIEKCRVYQGYYASKQGDRHGAFVIPHDGIVRVLVSCGEEGIPFDHVSVSLANRCPTWEEMCFIKDTFFEPEETVIQYHPPKSQYVNEHPFCLHLWKPIDFEIPMPPMICVGRKS